MRISILLPYKENFSPEYPGAVSLFVYETSKISKYKKKITVFGNTNYKKKFNIRYVNIDLKKDLFSSQTKLYVNKFINLEKKYDSDGNDISDISDSLIDEFCLKRPIL